MNVLYDHQIFSYQAFGGASRYYCELMAAFARAGEPRFELGVAESPNEYLARAPFYRGKTIAKAGTAGFLRTYVRNELATLAAARRGRHDILHATFYDPGVLRNVRGGKLVVTVLDMIPEHFPDFFDTSGWYGRFVTKRWIEGKRTLCERADAILAISEHTKQDVVAFYGIDPARITVTHLANNLAGGSDAPRPAGVPARYVLFVGTRNTYKNFTLFVEAVAPLVAADPELGVLCIGGGALSPGELELLARHALDGRVLQRSVRDDELAACYAHAAAFVFPSRYEGFGIPILEAFACGCPTLLANASCFPEIAADAALYFEPTDADSLRDQLRRLLADDALRAELRAKGLARAAAFTWDATAQRTLDAYRAALAGAVRAAS
jgi:glycosyltransferase involved in cell wall biosynthesis